MGVKKSENMRIVLSSLISGICLILLCWLITFNNYFLFSFLTLFIVPGLFLAYFFFTKVLNWWLTSLCFLLCFVSTNLIMNELVIAYPNMDLVDEESFPLSNYFIIDATL